MGRCAWRWWRRELWPEVSYGRRAAGNRKGVLEGRDEVRNINPSYLKGAHGVLYVVDGTRRHWQLGHEIALCGRLIKGYGATNERGKGTPTMGSGPSGKLLRDGVKLVTLHPCSPSLLATAAAS